MRPLKYDELALVAGGACYEDGSCDPVDEPPTYDGHANNGWGNGADGTNPGTYKGNAVQVTTKSNANVGLSAALHNLLDRFGGR